MTESEFGNLLAEILNENLSAYEVTTKESLLYRVIVNEEGELFPKDVGKPVRGQLAFQTDLLIKKDNLPLVVCELKINGFSTHDIITYSRKAKMHKDVYPYLRYGLIVGNTKNISNKFFTHNDFAFDFALAIENFNDKRKTEFITLVKKQIHFSEMLLGVLRNKNTVRFYETSLKIEHI